MLHLPLRSFLALALAGGLAAAAVPALADGPVVLTVSGKIANPNRGALDPEHDKLLDVNAVSFEKARSFDLAALTALEQVEVPTDFPMGGPTVTFSGPALEDVLEAAGAEGDTLLIQAIDGYTIEVPVEEAVAKGAVLALSRDGRAFGIGDFGPTQVVFPRGERADLADMVDDWWIWQIYHIGVE